MKNTSEIMDRFPKTRIELPEEYQKIYHEHYKSNRNGASKVSSVSTKLERWMHKQIAKDTLKNNELTTLELGAGTLNQLAYESTKIYDIVEPYTLLFENSVFKNRIRNIYADISEVPVNTKFDRITAIASFEHILNLTEVVAKCKKLLNQNGTLRVAIPNEGRFMWKAAYTLTTGREFKKKYGLDYSRLMNYEHCNTAEEIEVVLKHYFDNVKCKVFGINRSLAFYIYLECTMAN